MRVEVTNVTNGSGPDVYSRDIDSIVYTTNGDSEIVYEAGAIIRTDGSNGIMKREPPFLFTKDNSVRRAILPIIQTRSVGTRSIGGSTTVLVRTEESVKQAMTIRRNAVFEVQLTFETTEARAPIWETYLDEQIQWATDPCSSSGGTVTCTVTVDELYVTWTGIDTSLEN
jgi:hypothetical protein